MKIKESSEVKVETNHVPVGWMEITEKNHREDLQFAINQLEAREVPYIIKRFRGKQVSIWTKRR